MGVETQVRRQPRRVQRIQLDGDFDGWWADIDMDVDLGTQEDMTSGNLTRLADALGRMIVDWNFAGKDGEPLPCSRAGVSRIAGSLLKATFDAFTRLAAVPNA